MEYRRKPLTVEAVCVKHGEFLVSTENGQQRGMSGDWLVILPGGNQQVIDAATFAREYERTDGVPIAPPPQATPPTDPKE